MSLIRFAIVFSIISVIVSGSSFIFLKKRLNLDDRGNQILFWIHVTATVLMILGPILYRVYRISVSPTPNFLIQFAQYYLMGLIGMVVMVFGVAEIFHFLFEKFDPSKRVFLTEGVSRGLFAAIGFASITGFIQTKFGPKVERVTIKLPNLPKAFDGFTIAQLSDVHIGPLLDREFAEKVVQDTLALKADLIALTGDFVDGSLDQLQNHVAPFRELKAEHGVYFITGNHEYYSGADEWMNHFESFGFHVFRNSNKVIEKTNSHSQKEKLLIAGVFDLQGERFSPAHKSDPFKAAQCTEEVGCKILLAHNPRSITEAAEAGFHLQLSGHTHAGQFYPFTWVAGLVHQYFEGLYQVNDQTQIYVNRGTGYWGPPNRLGKTSEITLITLKC
jgi:predicted MPP superfamily phosphohydrolase